jgi:hypothetical protein
LNGKEELYRGSSFLMHSHPEGVVVEVKIAGGTHSLTFYNGKKNA